MFADPFDPVIPAVMIGAEEGVPGSIQDTHYLRFRPVHLAQGWGQCWSSEEDSQ